jgi:hypothetical protein
MINNAKIEHLKIENYRYLLLTWKALEDKFSYGFFRV